MLYPHYSRLLEWYRSQTEGHSSKVRVAFEQTIRLLVMGLSRLKGVRFPSRAIGGWWWTWRFRWELLAGWFEYDTLAWCHRLVSPGAIALDIGAHIGYYSWNLSRLVSTTGKVISYEPSPENYPILVSNCLSMRASNVVPINAAVSDMNGEVDLYVSPGNSNHSLNPGYTHYEQVIKVPALNLASHLPSLGISAVNFVKIDTEGSEIRVLRGMRNTIRNSPSLAMVVEMNPVALAAAGFTPADLLTTIKSLGFLPRVIASNARLIPPADVYQGPCINLLCVRADAPNNLIQ